MSRGPPACSLSFFVLALLARFCLVSLAQPPPLYPPTCFFFLPLHFLLTNILYSTDWHAHENHLRLPRSEEKLLRILNLPTISHLNKLAPALRLLHTVIVASPGSLFYLCSYFIHFSICSRRGVWGRPPPAAGFLASDLGLPEGCTVNEMWHRHMYLDKIYQWMN